MGYALEKPQQFVGGIGDVSITAPSFRVPSRTGNRKGLKTEKKGVEVKLAIFTYRAEQLLLLLESQTESTNENDLMFAVRRHLLLTETILKHLRSSANRCDVDLDGRTSYYFRHTFNTHLAKYISLN